MLLLRHALAALLDHRTHECPCSVSGGVPTGHANAPRRTDGSAYRPARAGPKLVLAADTIGPVGGFRRRRAWSGSGARRCAPLVKEFTCAAAKLAVSGTGHVFAYRCTIGV